MFRRTLIAAALTSLAVAVPMPSTARAVPVPLDACAPAVVAPGALPCLPPGEAEETALAGAARSGARVLEKVLSTASFGLL
jgi:hypothetical protein